MIEKLISTKLKKTDHRLDIENIEIKNIKNPLTYENGFDFTENFDGIIYRDDSTYYFNLNPWRFKMRQIFIYFY